MKSNSRDTGQQGHFTVQDDQNNFLRPPHNLTLFFSLLFCMVRIADNVITGADRRLKLYFYYSPVSGKNIVRRFTSLTGARVKKDAAFKGFRESGNRMKEASPIAASLYKMIPAEIKQYALYRLLTGEALKMLKAGLDSATITKTLKHIHIDPLLEPPVKERVNREIIRPGKQGNRPDGLANISRYFPIDSPRKSRIRRWRRQRTEQLTNNLPVSVGSLQHVEQTVSTPDHRISIRDNTQSTLEQAFKPDTKYPGLIYRCRLRECKKLKLWIRSSSFPGVAN
jgi:hypothetical protein